MTISRAYALDLSERTVATFVQGALGAIPLDTLVFHQSGLRAVGESALVGGGAALLALLKGWAAKHAGSADTAALLDAPVPPPDTGEGLPLSLPLSAAGVPAIVLPPQPRRPSPHPAIDDDGL